MKKSIQFLFMTALMLVSFASCSNDDQAESPGDKTQRSVVISISKDPTTYSTGPSVADQTTATFTTGHLYIVDASNAILTHVSLAAADISTLTAAGKTYTVLGMPAKAFIVGNVPATVTLPTAGPISAVKEKVLTIQSQNAADAGIAGITLTGEKSIIIDGAGPNYKTDGNVTLTPVVARIEIAKIIGTGAITGFDVEGIFVNNFYPTSTLGLTVAAPVDNGSTGANYGGATDTYAALQDLLADYTIGFAIPVAAAVSKTASPASSNVWAYNVFAGSSVPTIAIRLNNITTSNGSIITGARYLSIKGFKNAGSPDQLTTLTAGKVYKLLDKLTFDETKITVDPFTDPVLVDVTIEVIKWTDVNVEPVL